VVIAEAILLRAQRWKGTGKMQTELDVIRGMYSAFARGDVGSVLASLASEVVWIEAEGFPSAGTYTTPDAVLHKVFMRLADEWDAFGAQPQEYVCDGQTVVAIGDYSGTCKPPGRRSRHRSLMSGSCAEVLSSASSSSPIRPLCSGR
jgi:uncharacterized protein